MTIMFEAVDNYYKMPMQYKYAWSNLQYFGQFRDKHILKNFEYFIGWMENHFPRKKFFEVMGKSYDLDDGLLYRIIDESGVESWLMSNIFRYVENLDKNKEPRRKYTGNVRFTKVS